MSNYTPGPWRIYGSDLTLNQISLVGSNMERVVNLNRDLITSANLSLIEDTPELLEVLSLCVTAMETGMVDLNPHDEYVLERATKLVEKHNPRL